MNKRNIHSILFALLLFLFSLSACVDGKGKSGGDMHGQIGKEITITGIGHNTKDGIYLNDYIIDDFELPAEAEGKTIKLNGILKDVAAVEESGVRDGEIVQGRDGTSIHLKITGIKWKLADELK